MNLKNHKLKSFYSLFLVILILVAINIISSFLFFRYDMTEEKRYTLTNFTKKILKNIDGQIYITVYLEGKDLPIQFKNFKKAIKETLEEFKVYAGANLDFKFVNPNDPELTDDQRKALFERLAQLGIVPLVTQQVKQGSSTQMLIFPSALITYTYYDKKSDSIVSKDYGLNLLNNDIRFDPASIENISHSIENLEYKFINLIYKITRKQKPKIAFITGHGELPEAFVMDMEKTLSEYYQVMRGQINGEYGILDSFAAIIIAKPTKPFSEADKFVIDQYIMKGGKVLWLIDGVSADMDSVYYYNKTFAMPALPQIIKIDDQLFTYGVRINTDLVQDLVCSKILLKGITKTGEQRDVLYNWYYFPLLITHNTHIINRYIDPIRTEFISSIDTVGKNPKIKKTILLTTSEFSRIIQVNVPVEINFKEIMQPIDKDLFNKQFVPVAVLLEGKFPSLFKGRIVNKFLPKGQKMLQESVPTKMIVVSDGDIIKNVVKSDGEIMPLDFDRFSLSTYKGNKQFLMNAINYLCDDVGLMSIRPHNLKLRLLDSRVVAQQKHFWQVINTVLPSVLIILFGLILNYLRKRKYSR